jgi:hypothetical protein
MSLISTEKLIRSLTMLRRSAAALQTVAQQYLDHRAGNLDCHWAFDANGSGTKKTAPERRVVDQFRSQIGRAIKAMPEMEALAADMAKMAGEMEALRTRIEELAKVYELPPEPKRVGLEDLG